MYLELTHKPPEWRKWRSGHNRSTDPKNYAINIWKRSDVKKGEFKHNQSWFSQFPKPA
jgi:hypothetical protein